LQLQLQLLSQSQRDKEGVPLVLCCEAEAEAETKMRIYHMRHKSLSDVAEFLVENKRNVEVIQGFWKANAHV